VERHGQRSVVDVVRGFGRREACDGHAVLGECAGLVDAQHRGRAKRLDRRNAPREHVAARNAPCAQRQENRQHYGKLFRDKRHRQSDARQDSVNNAAASDTVADDHHHAEQQRQHRQPTHDAVSLVLESGALGRHALECRADAAHFRCTAGGHHACHPMTTGHERSGKHVWQVITAWSRRIRRGRAGCLADGNGFARQE
jgi:hypothetical protein